MLTGALLSERCNDIFSDAYFNDENDIFGDRLKTSHFIICKTTLIIGLSGILYPLAPDICVYKRRSYMCNDDDE